MLDIVTPAPGRVLALSAVPDPMFAHEMLGPGFAVQPTSGLVVSPVAGRVEAVLPSAHAVYFSTESGAQILLHVGIETVKLDGQHFTPLVQVGAEVAAGQPVLECDLAAIAEAGYATVIAVCFAEMGEFTRIRTVAETVGAGDIAATIECE